jgi:hypothetical protein
MTQFREVNMNDSGNNPNAGNPGGGPSHRKRNYRHFGPPAGAAPSSGSSGQQGGNRPPRPDNRGNRAENSEATDSRKDQQPRQQQSSRPGQSGQREGGLPNRDRNNRGGGQSRSGAGQNQGQATGMATGHPAATGPVQRNQPNQRRPGPPRDQREPREPREQRERRGQIELREPREPAELRVPHDNHDRQEKIAVNPQTQSSAGSIQQERQNRWDKRIKAEENYEEIKRDNERIEKEIWLEIAGIHTIKLDL